MKPYTCPVCGGRRNTEEALNNCLANHERFRRRMSENLGKPRADWTWGPSREDHPLRRDTYPKEFVPDLRERVYAYAEEHELVINEEGLFKIEYSEAHGGRCFCDPENRVCVCKEINSDLNKFGGTCLCRVLMTPEHLEILGKRREAYAERKLRKETPEETEKRKKQGISKYEEAKQILARMTGKK